MDPSILARETDALVWFCQPESQFELNKIVEDATKYWQQLDVKFAQVEDIITHALQADKYDTIKNELVQRISHTINQQTQFRICRKIAKSHENSTINTRYKTWKQGNICVFKKLLRTQYVVRRPLQTPYDGAYEVIKHGKKHFDVKVKDKTDSNPPEDINISEKTEKKGGNYPKRKRLQHFQST